MRRHGACHKAQVVTPQRGLLRARCPGGTRHTHGLDLTPIVRYVAYHNKSRPRSPRMTRKPTPAGQVLVRSVDRRLAGPRPVRGRHAPGTGPGRVRPPPRRAGCVACHVPRRRRGAVRLGRADPRPGPRSVQEGPAPTPASPSRWSRPTRSRIRSSRTVRSPPTTAASVATACARSCATSTWPPSSVPTPSSCGVAARARSTTAPRTSWPRTTATPRASTPSPATSRRRATSCGSPWSPSPTSPAATSCSRPSATRLASSPSWRTVTSWG